MHVLVSGPPASGKSTLAPRLAAELRLSLVNKDAIKDVLVGVLGADDLDESRRLGAAAAAVAIHVAASLDGAVVDSVLHRSRSPALVAQLRGPVVEVFCRCPIEVMRERYARRLGTGAAGHLAAARTDDELWGPDVAEPLGGGWPVVEVDTTGEVDVVAVVARVRGAAPP